MIDRRLAILLAGCAIVTVSACKKEEAPPPANNQVEAIVVRSAQQKALFDLNDFGRAIALKRAIQAQGLTCKQVSETGYVGRYKNMDVWTATCDGKSNWALFISAEDSVQVRNCKDLTQLGLPQCTIQPGTEGGTGIGEGANQDSRTSRD